MSQTAINGGIPIAWDSPPVGGELAVPSDTPGQGLSQECRGFMVMTAGDVMMLMHDGTTVLYPGCATGTMYSGLIVQVKVTGTAHTAGIWCYH